MITLKQTVADALAGACERLVYGYPHDLCGAPLVAWREAENRAYAQADAAEHLAELEYALELFDAGAEAVGALLAEVDARLCGAGFRRVAAAEQYEADARLSHISARYRAVADGAGNIYQ